MAFIARSAHLRIGPTQQFTAPFATPRRCGARTPATFRRLQPRAELPSEPPLASDVPDAKSETDVQSLNKNDNTKVDVEEKAREIGRDSFLTVAWIAAAGAVAYGMAKWKGSQAALQFVTAYIVEYSLSVDNLFVFLLLFSYFQVPRVSQTRVLSFGILGAIVFRGIMIVSGEALIHRFRGVSLIFAALLIFSAYKLISSGDEKNEDVSESAVVKFASKLFPFTDTYDGQRFFTTGEDGASLATPLMLVLLSIELSDIVFALDSVPAVLGISDDSLVIYLSNIMAIAGLRNLYFVLSDAIGNLRFLPQALAIVLAFVGGKMAAGVAGYEVGILPSLSVIVGALSLGVGLSIAFPSKEGEEEANMSQ